MTRCKICRVEYERRYITQKTCGDPICKAEQKRQDKIAKVRRVEFRQRKEAVKTRSEWIKEAQVAFNAFIRERDKYQPCISCGSPLAVEAIGGGFDCGHYRSVGSAPHLRYDERNAHGQCKKCNRYGSGRAVDYRIGLMKRIGESTLADLERDQTHKHYTIDDLKAIKAKYKLKLKSLKQYQKEAA